MRKRSRLELATGAHFSASKEHHTTAARIATAQKGSMWQRKRNGKGGVTLPKFTFSDDERDKNVRTMPPVGQG